VFAPHRTRPTTTAAQAHDHPPHPQHFLCQLLLPSPQQAALVACSNQPRCCAPPLLLLQLCCERAAQQRGSNNASPDLLPASTARQPAAQYSGFQQRCMRALPCMQGSGDFACFAAGVLLLLQQDKHGPKHHPINGGQQCDSSYPPSDGVQIYVLPLSVQLQLLRHTVSRRSDTRIDHSRAPEQTLLLLLDSTRRLPYIHIYTLLLRCPRLHN
jgi:hypothetical protein